MKSFKEYIAEAKISIKNDRDLIKALHDIEANATGKGKTLAMQAAEYIDDNELDQKSAKMINAMSAALGTSFSQNALVDAVEDYVEENL